MNKLSLLIRAAMVVALAAGFLVAGEGDDAWFDVHGCAMCKNLAAEPGLLDLTAQAMIKSPDLATFGGSVADSGEGRWTIEAAVDEAVPAPVLTAALYQRFTSRGESDFADKVLSAMRYEFGGHVERPTGG